MLEAIEMAGLEDFLKQDGITLFAPTDSFFKIHLTDYGVDSLSGLYNFLGPAEFSNFLKYHILEKKLKTMDVVSSYVATAASNTNGNKIHAYANIIGKTVNLNSYAATVIEADIPVEQSILHKVDGVIVPLTLNGLIRVNPNLSKMKSGISKSQDNIEVLLNQENLAHTIFCPNDAAISDFLNDTGYYDWNAFANANGNAALSEMLRYHILEDDYRASSLTTTIYSTLLAGHTLQVIKVSNGTINIQDEQNTQPMAAILTTDITAINGSLHIVDKVLRHN